MRFSANRVEISLPKIQDCISSSLKLEERRVVIKDWKLFEQINEKSFSANYEAGLSKGKGSSMTGTLENTVFF